MVKQNLGKEIGIEELSNNKPIHIVGVGNTSSSLDVAIKSIDAPPVIIKGENAELVVQLLIMAILIKNST